MVHIMAALVRYCNEFKILFTVLGSSRSSSISAVRKKTLPRQILNNMSSNGGILSLSTTPAKNLFEVKNFEIYFEIESSLKVVP